MRICSLTEDGSTGVVKADLNFDGDYDDLGEKQEVSGSGLQWRFDVYLAPCGMTVRVQMQMEHQYGVI